MCDCENCKGGTTVDSIAVRLAEIERAHRENVILPMDVAYLIRTLRQKMAECEEFKVLLGEYRKELIDLETT